MKKILLIVASVACITGTFHLHPVFAEQEAKTGLGPPVMCLDTSRIKETIILDDQTILFIMLDGGLYINRLPFQCPGLKMSNGFSYSTSIAKICGQDIISVIDLGSVPGSTCGLGDFFPFRYEGKSRDAIKLLKKSLLNKLVSEGAFKKG